MFLRITFKLNSQKLKNRYYARKCASINTLTEKNASLFYPFLFSVFCMKTV